MSSFQDWLASSFKPCCLVYCSDKAKEIIGMNNLTPSEFLRPFGDFRRKEIQIQFNEKEKEPINIKNFILDFYDNDKFKQIDKEKIYDYLCTMLKQNEPKWNLNSPLITKNYVEPVFSTLKHYSTQWFREYEKTLLECLHFDEYELYQQPLFLIFICSIEELTSVIANDLCQHSPKLISEKKYDSFKERLVITLNNCKDHSLSKEELEKCKSRFSQMLKNYHILHWDINCPPYNVEQKKISNNFTKYFHKTDIYNKEDERYKNYEKKEYGIYINADCYKKYKDDFWNYFNNDFIKKLHERIATCNETIKKNTGISRIFKKTNEINYYSKTKIYKFTELERAYYNLGLIYFYFHNYDTANEMFKLLRNCLKDKSNKHKERVKEMKAICKYLQKKEKKESKNEYNVVEEMNVLGTNEQIIRTIIVIIKMMEVQAKENNNFKQLIDTVERFANKYKKIEKDKSDKPSKQQIPPPCYNLFSILLREKIAIYNLYENKFRKYVHNMVECGKSSLQLQNLRNYGLYFLSNIVYFIDNPSTSFPIVRIYYNRMMGDACNSLKYVEGSFKFFKNCFEFSWIYDKEKTNQNSYLNYYISFFTQIKAICSNVDTNNLNILQVDNASLFVLENDDYNIKQQAQKMSGTDDKSWLVFNKYGESLTTDVYANLDESDLDHIKLIHDLTNDTQKVIANVHTDRYFHGNTNQKLFVKCTIKNPLSIPLKISSVKLLCQFIPQRSPSPSQTNKPTMITPIQDPNKRNSLEDNININDKINNNDNNELTPENNEQDQQHCSISISEENYDLKPEETKEIELNVSSPIEGKIIVKGIEYLLLDICKIVHLFSKKTSPNLYYYTERHTMYALGGGGSGSSSDFESRNSSEFVRNANFNNMIIPRKNKIEYIVSDYSNDVYVTFPLGTTVSVFLYQLFFFPIVVNNNSMKQRIRRYTIFIEECDKSKVKIYFNYITKDNTIKQRFSSETVLIPIIPIAKGKIYIKILIKFSGEMRVKPIQVKRYLIKLKVKESIRFDVKEYCSKLNIDKNGKAYNKTDFNIKTNLRIQNEKEIKNLIMKGPVYNSELNLVSYKDYLITNNEIHQKFVFIKENNTSSHNNQYKLEFIKDNIPIEKENQNNQYILDKFNKILNSPNGNIIFFPWEATHVIINEPDKKKGEETTPDSPPTNEPKEEKLQGLFPYNLKMESSEATKTFLSYLFNKHTELNVTHKKIDNEKTLIKMILTMNKTGLSSMGDKVDKYEIYVNDGHPQIIWLGPKKFIIKNNLDEKSFTCRFNFITTLKGVIEVNRISVLVYKKPENKGDKTQTINLNHITKPTSIFIG
jgi:hypothetical protein